MHVCPACNLDRLSAAAFDRPSPRFEQVDQNIPVVTLDFYDTVLQGSTRPAPGLELPDQCFELFHWQRDTVDQGYSLAFAALGLSADPHDAIAGRQRGGCFAADTSGNRFAAGRAHTTGFTRINQPGSRFFYGHHLLLGGLNEQSAALAAEVKNQGQRIEREIDHGPRLAVRFAVPSGKIRQLVFLVEQAALGPARCFVLAASNDASRSLPEIPGQFDVVVRIVQAGVVNLDPAMAGDGGELEVGQLGA